ncbi:hypothetical protein K440DRAFT_643894 [Wilcoxina mikolae CBS 423.85]|nr:hypothetical protein K440DRAFT_643894 [Wilcoxina mikolae CBS 423.85]
MFSRHLLLIFLLLITGTLVTPHPNYSVPLPTRIDALPPSGDQSPVPTQLVLDTSIPVIPEKNRTSTSSSVLESNPPSSATIVDVTDVLTMAPSPSLVTSGSCGRRLRVGVVGTGKKTPTARDILLRKFNRGIRHFRQESNNLTESILWMLFGLYEWYTQRSRLEELGRYHIRIHIPATTLLQSAVGRGKVEILTVLLEKDSLTAVCGRWDAYDPVVEGGTLQARSATGRPGTGAIEGIASRRLAEGFSIDISGRTD